MKIKNGIVGFFFFLLFEGAFLLNSSRNLAIKFQLQNPQSFNEESDDLIKSVFLGSCTYEQLTQSSQICETIFFKEFIQRNKPNCKNLYKSMLSCMAIVGKQCFVNETKKLESMLTKHGPEMFSSHDESSYCTFGALSLPSRRDANDNCDLDYYEEAKQCIRNYHNKFKRSRTDPNLCGEYRRARSCLYETQDRYCRYEEPMLRAVKKSTRNLYRCWNPFCVWRRRRVIGGSLSNYMIPEEEQRKGISDDCVVNTAFLKLSDKIQKSISNQRFQNTKPVERVFFKQYTVVNDDSRSMLQIAIDNLQQENPSATTPNGYAIMTCWSLKECIICFLGFIYILLFK